MSDAQCVAFLQWALPRLARRWAGYRKVRGQVCKRIQRRLTELGLSDVAAYRARLEADPAEWQALDSLCAVTISRFYRDRRVWDTLRDEVLPAVAEMAIAAQDEEVRCWSVGCASGEEPYTLSLLWELGLATCYPSLRLRVLGTDSNEDVLHRARVASYAAGTLRELPAGWREQAFEAHDGAWLLRQGLRAAVELRREDVRRDLPQERFRVILCRNSVLTYFDEKLQHETLARLVTRLSAGGAFLIGQHEELPSGLPLGPWHVRLGIYRRL